MKCLFHGELQKVKMFCSIPVSFQGKKVCILRKGAVNPDEDRVDVQDAMPESPIAAGNLQ
jgi:hypothetical protein